MELSRQLHRRRNQVVFALLAGLPFVLAGAFALGDSGGSGDLIDTATAGGANFALFSVFVTSTFLDIVLVALFFGDTVASEASWSSLRYLLAVPVPPGRLLAVKAAAAALLAAASLVLLPLVASASERCSTERVRSGHRSDPNCRPRRQPGGSGWRWPTSPCTCSGSPDWRCCCR